MRVVLTGGRDFDHIEFIASRIYKLHKRLEFTCVISGGARGVDRIGHDVAVELGIPTEIYEADWDKHKKLAGPVRNQEMIDKGRPDLCMSLPGGRGTADMTERVRQARIPVWKSNLIWFNSQIVNNRFLSNMAEGYEFVDLDGCFWPTSEHYYQSRKTQDEFIRSRIQAARNGKEAKHIGSQIELSPDWDSQKETAMQEAISLKFAPGSEAARKLLKTNEDFLAEHSPWGDRYWGITDGQGLNRLGYILMDHRDWMSDLGG